MTVKHFLRNNSVSVYGLVFDIEYYYTPGTAATDGHPGDDPEVEINTIYWTNSAGERQNVIDLILALNRAEQGKVSKLKDGKMVATVVQNARWNMLLDGIIEAIEQLEQNQ